MPIDARIRLIAGLIAAMLTAGCVSQLDQPTDIVAERILLNGQIYTAVERRQFVSTVAIANGRIVGAGDQEIVMRLAGPETEIEDLQGAFAMPGIHDAHFHLQTSIMQADACSPGQFPPSRLVEVLKLCKEQVNPDQAWMTIFGLEMWSEAVDNAAVDVLFPDTPVFIYDVSLHNGLANSAALAIAGIKETSVNPVGGVIVRADGKRRPTGVLVEDPAMLLVTQHIPTIPADDFIDYAKAEFATLFSNGVTSIQDAGTGDPIWPLIKTIDESDDPMPYVFAHLTWELRNNVPVPEMEAAISNRENFRSKHISPDGIKVFLDGIPVPPMFTHVPLDSDGIVDESNLLIPRDILEARLIEWDKQGLKVKMHASANGAAQVGLDAIAAARRENGDSGIRHETGHSSEIADVDLERYDRLGAVAEVSPYFWHLGGVVGGTGYQFRALDNTDALITTGSDYPVVASTNPFPPLQGILQRPGESVPLTTALSFLTRNGAESIGRLENLGTIETGKVANLIILDRNLFEIPISSIGQTKVVRTILDGKDVYKHGGTSAAERE